MDRAYIYILTNDKNTVLYVGSTQGLVKRAYLHRNALLPGFTRKYNVKKLVYYEECRDLKTAMAREKALKAGSRAKKIQLISRQNPAWIDLYPRLAESSIADCKDKKAVATSLANN